MRTERRRQQDQEAQRRYRARKSAEDPEFYRKRYQTQGRPWRQRVRQEAIEHYGGRCSCCGEDTPEFLHIHHVNGDGAAHRREIGLKPGHNFVAWLKRNGWPEGFGILCANCNMAEELEGGCPHRRT